MFVVPAVGSLALLAAAVIAAELLHRRDDDLGADEAAPDCFSVSAPIVAEPAGVQVGVVEQGSVEPVVVEPASAEQAEVQPTGQK